MWKQGRRTHTIEVKIYDPDYNVVYKNKFPIGENNEQWVEFIHELTIKGFLKRPGLL